MWSRRTFLQRATMTMATVAMADVHANASRTGPLGRPIGLQLYTLGPEANKDLAATLKTVANVGYREIELPGGPPAKPAAEIRKLMTDHELTCPSIHASMQELHANAEEKIELARGVGAQYLVCSFPWTADGRFGKPSTNIAADITMDDWKWNAEQLNRIGQMARKVGVRVGYHNHNMEFRSYDGKVAFDELIKLTDPSLVTIELDIAWVVTAGVDPIRYLRDYASRIELLHVKEARKDLQVMKDRLKAQTTELGTGQVDWPRLFAAMDRKHIKHYFVEQENFEGSRFDAIRTNFEYLQQLGTKASS